LSEVGLEDGKVAVGALWALVSALFYSIYLVTLRKEAHHEDALNMPLFFGSCVNNALF
jgi:drug/metabolite transporter (DMT)-like permease